MKETKIKTSLLSLTLEPGNKTLVRSVIFFYYRRKQESKTKDGRDLHCNNLDFDYCRHEHPELSV